MWTRPESVPFPSVWRRFEGRKEINGVIPKFWIQDIPEKEFQKVVQCMVNKFCGDEPVTTFSNLPNEPVSVYRITRMWEEVLQDKLGIICYMENPNKNGKPIFAGVNCTHKKEKVNEPTSPDIPFTAKAARKIVGTMDFLMKQKDAFQEFNTDVLLNAVGLYVFPEFRGQNIGLELLHAREDLCKAVGIKAAVTVFTSITSQILAKKAGYEELYEISYADLEKENPEFSFPGIQNHTKYIKYSYKVFE